MNDYVKRTGEYRLLQLLRSTLTAENDRTRAVAWILQLNSNTSDRGQFLENMVNSGLVPLKQREPIYERILELHKQEVAKSEGYEKEYAQSSVQQWQITWLEYLLKTKQFDRAGKELETMSADARKGTDDKLVPIELQTEAPMSGNELDAKHERRRDDPD